MRVIAILSLVFGIFASPLPSPSPQDSSLGLPIFFKGHDLSSVKLLNDGNVVYKDTARDNVTRPVEAILGDGGMNTVRLRIWVHPSDGIYNLTYNLALASRFHAAGYSIYLDFHFSDTWADPSKQFIPAAWPTDLPGLKTTLRSYVSSTLLAFKKANIPLAIVSLGNEIRHGMLWPLGYVDVDSPHVIANFTNLAQLYHSARLGVTDAVAQGAPRPAVMVHIDDGWNQTLQQTWFGALTGTGYVATSEWDMFGFSFYPFYGTAATFKNLQTTLDTLAVQYRKPLVVAETDWPEQCDDKYGPIPTLSEPSIPVSAQGQIDWTEDVVSVVRNTVLGLGRGVFYWEPAWLGNNGLGSACEDAILFDGDWSKWPSEIVGYSRLSVNLFK